MDIAKKLQLLRNEMQQKKIDIYIIPATDAHNSEYVPKIWDRRTWISNFDGSAGEAIVTLEHAYLWTDGRYFLQAGKQLDSKHYTLMKQDGFAPGTEQWLLKNAQGKRLGIDPQLISIGRADRLKQVMQDANGEMVIIEYNLVDKCRSDLDQLIDNSLGEAFALPIEYTGESLADRLKKLRDKMIDVNADYIALNVLDEIAWLLNIRGSDIDYNPLVICNAVIGKAEAWLFVDKHKIPASLAQLFKQANVHIANYAKFGEFLESLQGSIWLDDKTANYWMLDKAAQKGSVIFARSPIVLAKACKNEVEANGSRFAHVKDAVAVINFLCWLDNNWQHGVTELSCAEKLFRFRSAQEHLKGNSFNTISGFAANGAIIHYRVTKDSSKIIDDTNLYLIDSGGQYLEGTTDITRTVHLGIPTSEQKRHYTLVLKGHLALGRAVFPFGTMGEQLDVLARAPLWNEYLNYRHGTGHGVGSFLCVHEGPQKISQAASGVPLLPGMIVSNEPGLYLDGQYGIRIENLCLVREIEDKAAKKSDYGPFYQFEDLTLIPYCKKLIDETLLSPEDKAQLKTYYANIKKKIRGRLGGIEQKWLDEQIALFS